MVAPIVDGVTSAPPPIDPDTTGQPASASSVASDPPVAGGREVSLPMALLIYTALRVLLVAVLTALLTIFMPLIVALLFAFVLQLPLAWVLFGTWRRRVNDGMARATASRRSERARLQDALSGDPSLTDTSPVDPPGSPPTGADRPATDPSATADRPAGPSGA